MRIIAGQFGGRVLYAPAGDHTRPTADRAREALFSILGARVQGARVLDIFAGSGAMALEALSRGAERAVMIDSDSGAVAAIRRNTQALGVSERVLLLGRDFHRALRDLTGQRFSLVFADPPYAKAEYYPQVMGLLEGHALMEPGALLVAEHAKSVSIEPLEAFEISDRRRYGDTAFTILRYRGAEGTDEGVRDTGQL